MAEFQTKLNSFKMLGIALDIDVKKEEKPVETPTYEKVVITKREQKVIELYKDIYNALREAKIPFETCKRYFIFHYQKPYMELQANLYLYIVDGIYRLSTKLMSEDDEIVSSKTAKYIINELNDYKKWM